MPTSHIKYQGNFFGHTKTSGSRLQLVRTAVEDRGLMVYFVSQIASTLYVIRKTGLLDLNSQIQFYRD